ncbi:MAG: SRPBCC family protein [Phycisphaerales bacterium]
MRTIATSRTIAAPPARVFDIFSDLRTAPQRVRSIIRMEVLTDGPIGRGTRVRDTRKLFGKEATANMEIIDFQPGRSLTFLTHEGGMRYTTRFTFAPEGAGTRAEVHFTIEALTFTAKLCSPLMALMSGMMRKCFQADFADLQAAAEGEGGRVATSPGPAAAQPT